MLEISIYNLIAFQSTLPRGERPFRRFRLCRRCSISIHAPARGATLPHGFDCPFQNEFQSTLPRGERQKFYKKNEQKIDISIHAPARGATLKDKDSVVALQISIHAPARGATKNRQGVFGCHGNFNPRSREGSDFNFI